MTLFPPSEETRSPTSDDHRSPFPNPALLKKKYDKREKNHRTVKAKQILESINAQICASLDKLSNKPTHELLQEVESKIGHMHSALEKITRTTWSLVEAKRKTSSEIQRLEARVLHWRAFIPTPPQVPLDVPNGTTFLCYALPIRN